MPNILVMRKVSKFTYICIRKFTYIIPKEII